MENARGVLILRDALPCIEALVFNSARSLEMSNGLPAFFQEVSERFPEVFRHYSALGESVSALGAMDEKTQELVKLGIAIGAGTEGAVHSHTRRALGLGATEKEIVQCALLAITAIGWPGAMAALTWIDDIIADIKSE